MGRLPTGFDERVVNATHAFTDNEKQVLAYIHQHPQRFAKLNLSDLATETHFSDSFISKLVKKIGYSSYAEMRYELKRELTKPSSSGPNDAFESQQVDINKTNSLLLQTDFAPINRLIANSHAIYVYGTGHSQMNYMRELSRNLMDLVKVPVIFLSGQSEFEASLSAVHPEDCFLIASNSGESQSLIQGVKLLVLSEVPVISFTIFADNTLSQLATYSLYYFATQIQNPTGRKPIISFLPFGYCIDYVIREYVSFLQGQAESAN